MSATAPGSLILIGPPGAGCSSVARAIGSAQGLPVLDLGQLVADQLGTRPELALVAVVSMTTSAMSRHRVWRSWSIWTNW